MTHHTRILIPVFFHSKYRHFIKQDLKPDAHVRIEENDKRSVGNCVRHIFAAYIARHEDSDERHLLRQTFRQQDLLDVLTDEPQLMSEYQQRVRELVKDPTKTCYGRGRDPDTGKQRYMSREELLDTFKDADLDMLTGAELLVDEGADPRSDQVRYRLFPGIADVWSPLRIDFTYDSPEGSVKGVQYSYTGEQVFRERTPIRELVTEGLCGITVEEMSTIGYDDSLISNDVIVYNLRELIVNKAKERFRQYVTGE